MVLIFSRPQGTWFRRGEPRKKSPVTPPGIDPGTVRQVAQCLNHYATPGPFLTLYSPQILCLSRRLFAIVFQIKLLKELFTSITRAICSTHVTHLKYYVRNNISCKAEITTLLMQFFPCLSEYFSLRLTYPDQHIFCHWAYRSS